MKATVICHFYNEEKLLPHWLRLHTRHFDHGVMIDYDSTDRSVEIIRDMAPTWTLVKTANNCFDSHSCDEEVIAIETMTEGWKIALNVTEFLLIDDLRQYLAYLEKNQPYLLGVLTEAIVPYDRPSERPTELQDNVPPWRQKDWGIVGSIAARFGREILKSRLLHRATHGMYSVGRHRTKLSPVAFDENLFLFSLTLGLPDWKIQRNRTMATRISERDVPKHGGHVWSDEETERQYQEDLKHCVNLLDLVAYRKMLDKIP